MGNRTKLLATVALPLASLIWQPAYAASVRPAMDVTTGNVILAQGQELTPEELRKQRQQQRQERRQEQRQQQREGAQEQRQQQRQERQQQRQRAQQEEQQQQQERQQRRKAQQERQQRAEEQQRQADQQKAREERRKQQQAERRKEQQADEQRQADQQKAREERRKEQKAGERRADEQRTREERRDARKDEQRDRTAAEREQRQEERRRERQAGQQDGDRDTAGERPRRRTVEERERIARDPSKTTETVELPVEDGAAVLDSEKEVDGRRGAAREERRRERAEQRRQQREVRIPRSDADAQVDERGNRRKPVRVESALRERGERLRERPGYREEVRGIEGVRVERRLENRFVINIDNRTIVRHDEGRRLVRRAKDNYYERLPNNRTRHVIVYPNGDRVVTIRNRWGDVVQRSRFVRDREFVLFYAPVVDRPRPIFIDPAPDLPPMRLTIPVSEYILDTSRDANYNYYDFLDQPPVEPVERVYTLDEVRYSARIRDKMRRIDLDTISFDTGSAEISMDQASSMRQVADAMNRLLDENPGETFLIEGHTDAVGSDESNLVLSDQRAESVAIVLTDVFDIPAENLVTQGYGERFLKIETDGAEQANRRVTIRRVTPLVKPVESAGLEE